MSVAAIVALAALVGSVGADSRWLAALGHAIVVRGSVPAGVPFAAAPSGHWANPLVLSELIFYGLEHVLGDRGLMLAQLLAAAGALALVARDARAGGAEARRLSGAVLIAGVAALPTLAIARDQLFSILLFPLLIALARAEARAPSRRIWLAVPLLALWANLHGGVLLGAGVLFAYLAVDRLRRQPLVACGVAGASVIALCATPALLRTVDYYHGVLTNQAAQSGEGMWAPLSLTSPLDVLLIACAAVLAVRFVRARPAWWELGCALALAAMTVGASRDGVFLVLFLAPVAARAARTQRARSWDGLVPVAVAVSIAVLGLALVRGPDANGASPWLVARAVALAHGSPVLATDVIAEQVALAGGRVWVSDPIDAFSGADQRAYLAWLDGTRTARTRYSADAHLALVPRGSAAARLTAATRGFHVVAADRRALLYEEVT